MDFPMAKMGEGQGDPSFMEAPPAPQALDISRTRTVSLPLWANFCTILSGGRPELPENGADLSPADRAWLYALEATAAERDGSAGLARERWEMAEGTATQLGFGEEMKEFRANGIAYLLPPSDGSVERMRRRWERRGDRQNFKRYLVSLARSGREMEARRLLERHLDTIEDPELILLGALLWPEDSEQAARLLRQVLLGDGPTDLRTAALRLLLRRPGGEELFVFLVGLPEPDDRELRNSLRLARLELALRHGHWHLAKSLAATLFHETPAEEKNRVKFLRLWLWLALEQVPTDYGEIATLLRRPDCARDLRRTVHLALADHYRRQGNSSLAQRFLEECGPPGADPLDPEELALRVRIAFANGQLAIPWGLLKCAWNSGRPPPEELFLEANGAYMDSTLAHQWNRWLAEIFAGPSPCPSQLHSWGTLIALHNAILLGDLQMAERLSFAVGDSEKFPLGREQSAELQLNLIRLAMARGDDRAVREGLNLLRENFPDGDGAMDSYFVASEYFESKGAGEAALDELRAFLDRYGESERRSEAIFQTANLLAAHGNSADALAALADIGPDSPYGWRGRLLEGDLRRMRREWGAAEAAYRSLLAANPPDCAIPFARLGLAKCLLINPSPAARREALETLEWLSAEPASNGDFALEAGYALALALRREGDWGRARQALEKGVQSYRHERKGQAISAKGNFWLSASESLLRPGP
ncbi:MAG: hypothetical protein LBB14_02885 [Puniceicoccales bacterium]|jgi:tetratricopeptide (TPR) repeat protein|nr:hypothetical protein [Puniceicoccales bacterium]